MDLAVRKVTTSQIEHAVCEATCFAYGPEQTGQKPLDTDPEQIGYLPVGSGLH